jgi:hypothetical protein
MGSDIVFLYDQVIETLARLHAFSSVRAGDPGSNDVEDDIDHVAELMAKRDLLTFAASARNFAEASKTVGDMRSIGMPTCKLLPPPPAAPFFAEGSETITCIKLLAGYFTPIRLIFYGRPKIMNTDWRSRMKSLYRWLDDEQGKRLCDLNR